MIKYYDELPLEEQNEITQSIQVLMKQTFLLERKYDKRTERIQYNKEFRICDKHIEFIRSYFAISGIQVIENSNQGIIYIQGDHVIGDKLPKLATLYLLILKLFYDEQMSSVSSSVHMYTTISDIHERLGSYRLLRKQPSITEIRKALALLKKYQVIDPLDVLETLDSQTRIIIYPCINVILLAEDVMGLLEAFEEGEEEDEESEI